MYVLKLEGSRCTRCGRIDSSDLTCAVNCYSAGCRQRGDVARTAECYTSVNHKVPSTHRHSARYTIPSIVTCTVSKLTDVCPISIPDFLQCAVRRDGYSTTSCSCCNKGNTCVRQSCCFVNCCSSVQTNHACTCLHRRRSTQKNRYVDCLVVVSSTLIGCSRRRKA